MDDLTLAILGMDDHLMRAVLLHLARTPDGADQVAAAVMTMRDAMERRG